MADKIIFDSSALIMFFAKEPGYEMAGTYMGRAMMSSVNIAEVYKYCMESQHLTEDECSVLVAQSRIEIIPFNQEQALITAKLVSKTKKYSLSLGDRACIALTILNNCPVLTCDKIWKEVDLGIVCLLAR